MAYNAQNRPVRFTQENADGTRTVITAAYDYMGRRAWKKVETIVTDPETGEETATVSLHQRYIYRGYLQIAACDLTRGGHPCLWLITWDPTQPIATRPLALQKDGTWYCYGWDLTKNICEVFGQAGYIRTTYAYTPYGSVTEEGDVTHPLQWSSEYADSELGLIYYNYRYYNPRDGRWIKRDPLEMKGGINVYSFVKNQLHRPDILGLVGPGFEGAVAVSQLNKLQEDNRRDNKQALIFCNQYAKYIGDKCCRNGQIMEDPYIAQAMQMCKQFVYKYSRNGRVIHPVECVAKCLSNYEAFIKDVPDCQKRNSLRLQRHVGCYLECGFFLFDENNIGVPEGGWGIGLRDLLPDFLKDIFFL